MPTKPWKDLEGHYFRIDVGSTAAAAMQGDPYTIYYTTEGYIVLNGEMMGRTITDDSSPIQVIDLAALDPNTWYPVTCILPENLPTNVLTIKHHLWGWAGPIPPWASHSSGFYAFMRVTCNPSQWGANVAKSLVTHNANQYVKGASPIFFKRTTYSNVTDRNQSCAIFYLRGGTTYHGSIQIGNDLEIEKQYLAPWAVHPDGFTDKGSNETYLPISDTSKLPANIPDVPARLDTLESTVKTKADASAVYDRATVDQKIAATDAKNAAHKAVFSWINNGYKDAQLKQWMKIGTEDRWYIEPYAANRPDTKVGDKVTGVFPASDTKNLYILHFEIIGLEKNSAGKIIQGQLRVLSSYIIPNGEAGYKRLDNMEAAIGTKVESSAYIQKVDELEKKDGQLNTAIGQQAKRIDKVQDVGIVAFTDVEASVTNIQQASVSLNFAICYAEMQNVFVAKTIENGVAKYYNNWPTAEMYNKDGVARADKLYMRFTNGTMVPYAYHPVMRKLVAIPAGVTSGTDSLENCIKKLENKHLALRKKIKKPYLMVGRRVPYGAFPGSAYYVKHPYPFKISAYDITSKLTFSEPVNLYNEQTRSLITATEVTLADVQNGYNRFVPVSMATQIDGVNPVIIVCNKQQMSPDHWDLSNYTIPLRLVNLNQYHQPCQTSRLVYCEEEGGHFELRLLPPRPLTLKEARLIANGKIPCITQYYRRCAGMDGRHSVLYRPRGIVSNTKVLKKVSGMCTSRTFVVYRRVHHGSRLVIAGRFRVLNGKSVVLI